MTPQQLIEAIRHGLPGVKITMFDADVMAATVMLCGDEYDISVNEVDGYPVFLVTTGAWELNAKTAKVLADLDSILPEVIQARRPWADYRALIRRLRQLRDEGEGDESADLI